MDFGNWVRVQRERQEMDVRAFARLTGVDASTISRIEQARSQVTLWTAVRMCERLNVTPGDLLAALRGKRPPFAAWRQAEQGVDVVTVGDLEAFVSYMRRTFQEGSTWLTSLLNQVAAREEEGYASHGGSAPLIVPEDIEKLLQDSPLYQFKVQYPAAITAEDLWEIYLRGGALSLVDIGAYLKHVRRARRVTLSGLEESGRVSASVISRLETGSLERVKLIDVLTLDEQLGQEGKLVVMYWRACMLIDAVARLHQRDFQAGGEGPSKELRLEQEWRLIELFTTICRWLACLEPNDHSWMSAFRQRWDHAPAGVESDMAEDVSR
jgi:transcriptional regulator with XRE-family HTH domain